MKYPLLATITLGICASLGLAGEKSTPTETKATASTAKSDESGFVPLFNGKDTEGWKNPYEWGEVGIEGDEITLKANKKFFLVTERPYGDFIFEGEVKVPEGKANSGFMVRANVRKNKVFGYQAEVDPSERAWAGGLYDEGRRLWLNPLTKDEKARAAFDRTKWNKYRIEFIGDHLKIYVNDVLTTDYVDSMDIAGPIGIQHHGEKGQVYRFRNLRVKELGNHEWRPLFNGKNLEGWHATPGGDWKVEDGVIIGTSTKDEKNNGLLLSDKMYKDFTVRFQFKAHSGNSGFYFRVQPVDPPLNAVGMQAEIDAEKDVGGVYEVRGRGWLLQPKPEDVKKYFKPGEWNDMTVSVHGNRMVVHVNGTKTVDLVDDKIFPEGYFGFQLHAGKDMKVEFRDVQILQPIESGH